MSMSTRDLWEDVPDAKQDSPDVILREQGQWLADKTNNEVRGYVPLRPVNRGSERFIGDSGYDSDRPNWGFTADFYFEVPNLNGYRHLFLEVKLPVSMGYPVTMTDHINAKQSTCHSQDEFEQALQAAFKSKAVRDVIAGLRTASRGMNQAWSRPLTQE
jgi:hypothetical protein